MPHKFLLIAAVPAMFLIASAPLAPAVGRSETPSLACLKPNVPSGQLTPRATPISLNAAESKARTSHSRLAVGRAARLTLLSTPNVRFPHPPKKPGSPVSYGGLVRVDVAEAGTYRVALSSAAWVDLVRGGQAITSIKHGHGPDCTGIRKMVDYPLQPGRYILQVSANGEQAITVLVSQLR